MVKVVIGTKVCSFEELVEEYGRVCEENEELRKQISEFESELSVKEDLLKIRNALCEEEPLPFSDEQYEGDKIAELEERISKIENFIQEQTEAEIKRLKAENKYMKSQIMQSEFVKGVIKS